MLRTRDPSVTELLDALPDDEAMAAWRARWSPDRLAPALSALSALSWQWNAKAGDTGRALLTARRQVQIVDLPWQWHPHGSPHFAGRALLLADALGSEGSLLSGLGSCTEALAVLREAEEWLEVDRAERERTGRPLTGKLGGSRMDHDPRSALYRQLAAVAERAGDPEAARHDDLADARDAGVPVSDHMGIAQLCAAALLVLDDDEVARCFSYLDDALPLAVREASRSPVEHALAVVHHTRARALASLGLHRTALRHFAEARQHNSGNADRLAEDRMRTAECLVERPALGDPLEAYERVLQLAGVSGGGPGDGRLVWRSRHSEDDPVRIENAARAWQAVIPMARAAWTAGEAETATDVLELGVELADLVRAAQPDPELRRRLQDEGAEVHELLVRYRLDGGDERAAFAVTERLRSRTLLDSLSTAALRPPDGVPPELLAEEAVLLSERTALERAPRTDWARMHTVRQELARLWSALAAGQPAGREHADIRSGATVSADAALERLRGEQVVVASYGRLNDGRLVVFTLDPRAGIGVTPVDADGDRLLRFVADNLGGAGQVREMAEDLPDLFQQVLGPLVAPLTDRLRPGDTALICPTGPLHHVPFQALSPDGGPLLLERNAVAYLPSVSLLRTLDGRSRPSGHGSVVVGDPGGDLPHAGDEARLLAGRLGAEPLLGAAATRERVLASMARAEVLHAAWHASFRSDDPLGSGLVLADGLLTGLDILRQQWHGVRLAVLSACETGLGDVGRTDEALGLSRSLLFAGVRSLVMSLWRVPDRSTAALMADFHDLTLAGEPPTGALRTAMPAARERPGGSRLDQWAAFCLVGEWRSPKPEHRTRSVV
ncbi:CHAT domain-containing protein [Streptomyces sp. A1277]|uniref:CHAT domain-containing protein n=1 Tax=Streptomyces sp. A1277 TaxID=2563103 RepID=UPI0010A21D72|nr:CHAT domain-containing protein [Streptomyces sp. A1277]THA35207.1 CHAT domain-containing protein [Streptomyces sp. A1277]